MEEDKHHSKKRKWKGAWKKKSPFLKRVERDKTICKETQIFSMETLYFGELSDIIF